MLRRKLLLILGSLVTLLVAVAVAAIWLLQTVLQDLDHINIEASTAVAEVDRLSTTITAIEVELYELQSSSARHFDPLVEAVEGMRQLIDQLGQRAVAQGSDAVPVYQAIVARLPQFERYVSAMATTRDRDLAREHNQQALSSSVALRRDVLQLGTIVRNHAHQKQEALTGKFRWMVLGLAVVFLLMINLAAVALLRTATMVLRPVDRLVLASRQLALERFDHRVNLDQHDEFDELAQAYNRLAAQLQANEQRKIEVLGQVAVALNHELNNAMAIIELQLELMGRQSGGHAPLEKHLRQIRENLQRMGSTVESLKHVRRIVLTDYGQGEKMLDLRASVRESPPLPPPAPARTA